MPDMLQVLLTVAALAVFLPGPATAAARSPAAGPPAILLAAADEITLDDAIRKVRETYGEVTILKAEPRGRNGNKGYLIKFLTDSGRVKTVTVDATTGEIR